MVSLLLQLDLQEVRQLPLVSVTIISTREGPVRLSPFCRIGVRRLRAFLAPLRYFGAFQLLVGSWRPLDVATMRRRRGVFRQFLRPRRMLRFRLCEGRHRIPPRTVQ